MIIVEGMDNTGKTTLINSLVREVSPQLIPRKSPGPGKTNAEHNELVRWCWHQLLSPYNSQLILDRWALISDPIYGPVIRGYDIFDSHPESDDIHTLWRFTPSLIIYCRPPDTHVFNTSKPEMPGVIENAQDLLTIYDATVHEFVARGITEAAASFNLWVYDYTVDDLPSLVRRVEQWLKTIA